MVYFNLKYDGRATETVDEIDPKDYPTYKAFITEVRRLVSEYRLAGMAVYTSSRSTKEWREKP